MREYEFTLRFSLPPGVAHSDELVERLGDAGCDDALIGTGHIGRLALDFVRDAPSARDAVFSAIGDVRAAIPGALLVEALPDLVGVTDVADYVGCSRQNMRKLLITCSPHMPTPVHEGTSALWHLAPLLDWLARDKGYDIDARLLEVSETTMRVNAAVDALAIERRSVVAPEDWDAFVRVLDGPARVVPELMRSASAHSPLIQR